MQILSTSFIAVYITITGLRILIFPKMTLPNAHRSVIMDIVGGYHFDVPFWKKLGREKSVVICGSFTFYKIEDRGIWNLLIGRQKYPTSRREYATVDYWTEFWCGWRRSRMLKFSFWFHIWYGWGTRFQTVPSNQKV